MTSCVPVCVRVLLALLFLIETNQTPQVRTVQCQSKQFKQGEIITTKNSQRNYCGSPVGWFFAVKVNILFHLKCAPGATSPCQATAKLLSMNDQATRTQTFDSEMLCDIQSPEGVTTGNNAHLIAQKLAGSKVPYDRESCNAQHYIEYMAYGIVNNAYRVKNSCPVFKTFNSGSTVNPSVFRLTGRGVVYEWPTGSGGALTPSTAMRQSSGSFTAPNPRRRSLSPYREQVSQRTVVSRKGGGGGGGGHGGGGHAGSGGGHAGSGGGRGGSGSEGGDSSGSGGNRVPYNAAAAAGGAHRQSSSSTRLKSLWSWGRWSWRSG